MENQDKSTLWDTVDGVMRWSTLSPHEIAGQLKAKPDEYANFLKVPVEVVGHVAEELLKLKGSRQEVLEELAQRRQREELPQT